MNHIKNLYSFWKIPSKVNMENCNCKTRIAKTVVTRENNQWKVEYYFDRVSDRLIFVTEDFAEIKFPPAQLCPNIEQYMFI